MGSATTHQAAVAALMSVAERDTLLALMALVVRYGKLLLQVGVKDKALAPVVDLQPLGEGDSVVLAVAVD